MNAPMHDELLIDEDLVRSLLERDLPDHAECPLRPLDSTGSTNRLFRLDEATWLRSRGWALFISVMTFPYYWKTMPVRCADRLVTARAALN